MKARIPDGALVTVKWSHARHLIGRVATVTGWDNYYGYYIVKMHYDGEELRYSPIDVDTINEIDALLIESDEDGWFQPASKFRKEA